MGHFPYPPRPFQAEAVALVRSTAADGGHLALEAPTGTGKTVVLLSGALDAIEGTPRRILYVTRTNSQQDQALREITTIGNRRGRPVKAVALQGRHRLCLKLGDANDPDLEESSPEDLSHYCSHAKRLAESDPADPKACGSYSRLLEFNDEDLAKVAGPDPLTAEAFKALGRANGFCSYEAAKRLLPEAEIVVAPYVFAFDPGLRARLLQWWRVEPADVALIVDEAHNLPAYLRELFSPRLGREALRRALSESEALNHPIIGRDFSTRTLLEALAETMDAVVAEFAQEEDGFVPPFEVESALLEKFRLTTNGLLAAADHMVRLGEVIKDRRRLQGRVPKSHLASVGAFLRRWVEGDETTAVKLVVREPRPYLELYSVDATEPAKVLQEFHATIHASGTLAPLAEYRDALGLGDTARLERFPSPFPPGQLQVIAVRGLTTKYERLRSDPKLVDALQDAVRRFVDRCDVSAAVFFPSHQLLREFDEVGVLDRPDREVLRESRELSQERLMQMVQEHRSRPGRGLIAGVLGGRLSEGMDFPGRELEALLMVGAPFPKPSARQRSLFQYYESKWGKGWDYSVRAPAIRRLRQAIGRLIRGPEDRGFAVILDERAQGLLESDALAVAMMGLDEALEAFGSWQGPGASTGALT